MDYVRGFWTIKGIENIILDMKIGEELYFTLDTPKDLETQEPSGWYGIRKDIILDGDVIIIGYMGGGDTALYNVRFDMKEPEPENSIEKCIRCYIRKYLEIDGKIEMLYIEYEKRGKKEGIG